MTSQTTDGDAGASRWRHKKRGSTYVLLGVVEAQCAEPITDAEILLLYRSEYDHSLWVRRRSEFMDGRFERLPETASGQSELTPNASRHPYYGPCDGIGPGGSCAECVKLERAALLAVLEAARQYRGTECDGTPRMFRGKELQDLANTLDNALAHYDSLTKPGEP